MARTEGDGKGGRGGRCASALRAERLAKWWCFVVSRGLGAGARAARAVLVDGVERRRRGRGPAVERRSVGRGHKERRVQRARRRAGDPRDDARAGACASARVAHPRPTPPPAVNRPASVFVVDVSLVCVAGAAHRLGPRLRRAVEGRLRRRVRTARGAAGRAGGRAGGRALCNCHMPNDIRGGPRWAVISVTVVC